MKQKRLMVVVAAVILQSTLLFAPVQGQNSDQDWSTDLRNRSDNRRYSWETNRDLDRIIRQAYEDILRREPDEEGLRYYRSRMIDSGWTEGEVREDLQRSREYGRDGTQVSRRQAEQIVRRAYLDVLGREPDPGAQGWVDKVLRDRWTEQDVVRALRDSDEYRHRSQMTRHQAEQIVRRAYLDVLEREPDPGAQGWVDKVLRDRWTEQDVVRALVASDEYRHRGQMTRHQAEQIVRRAYLDVLRREPDPGAQGWVDKVLRERWTEQDVVRALRDSDEYRSKRR